MNTYENLQKVQPQFFTNKLILAYIWSNSNIFWFISIQIRCQQTQSAIQLHSTMRNIVTYLMSSNKGNLKLFTFT
jgi:hypothetical protein